MKALICEMCGSQDLVKQNGYFVCQNCGTKYSVEDARKMMVEGTVTVDNSAHLANLYQVARRAKENNDSEGAAKYYEQIQLEDPTSWEASFYTTYFKAMSCKIIDIRPSAILVSNCLSTVMRLIRDCVVGKMEQIKAVTEVSGRCFTIAEMLKSAAKNHYDGIEDSIRTKYTQEYLDRACAARDILYTCGNAIEQVFGEDPQMGVSASSSWKAGVKMHEDLLSLFANHAANQTQIDRYVIKIGKYDPKYAYARRKKQAEQRAYDAKAIIALPIQKDFTLKPAELVIGLLCTAVGIGVLILGIMLDSPFVAFVGLVAVVSGIVCISKSFNSQSGREKACLERREKAQHDLAAAERELQMLKKTYGIKE